MSRKRVRDDDADDMKNEIASIVSLAVEQAMKKAREDADKNNNGANIFKIGTSVLLFASGFLGSNDAKSAFEKKVIRIFGSMMNVEYECQKAEFLSYPDSVNRYVLSVSHIHRVPDVKLMELSELEGVFNVQIDAENGFLKIIFNHTSDTNVLASYNLDKPAVPIAPVAPIEYNKAEKTPLEAVADRIINSVKKYFRNVKRINEDELPYSVLNNGQRMCALSLSVDAPVFIDQVKYLRVDKLICGTLFTTMAGSSTLVFILETVLPG
jgi:hypothetical protein